MRGKRCGWVSKVESLNAAAPASTSACDVARSARAAEPSPTARRRRAPRARTSATLASNASTLSIGPGGVVGHVDDRRHAAGRGRPRAALDPLAGVAAGVDVDVDGAGEQQRVAEVERRPPASHSRSTRPSRIVTTGPLRRAVRGSRSDPKSSRSLRSRRTIHDRNGDSSLNQREHHSQRRWADRR